MLGFETLTLAPIDRRLIDASLLEPAERAWLDAYHRRVAEALGPLIAPEVRTWLEAACRPL
jgi:Xaa-Pro aminopeptidase